MCSWSYGNWIYNYLCNQCITTKVVCSNPVHGEEYSIQHYVMKFVDWLATGQWFSLGIAVYSTNKTDLQDITEILLKVALNTINHNIWVSKIFVEIINKHPEKCFKIKLGLLWFKITLYFCRLTGWFSGDGHNLFSLFYIF